MAMIYPMFALILLTFAVATALGLSRVMSVKNRHVSPAYYKLMEGGSPPEYVVKLGRNFTNLLEVPVLFYVFGAIVIATDVVTSLVLTLAWVYVGLRLMHTAIHVTYNNPAHRFLAFLASGLVLIGMWVWLVLEIGGKASA